jgi:hypothetical protein
MPVRIAGRSKEVEGDSLLNAVGLLALALLCAIDSSNARFRRIEIALALIVIAGAGLSLAGYDLRVGWRYLEEVAFIAAALVVLVTIVRWGRRELAEGEYDEPLQHPD